MALFVRYYLKKIPGRGPRRQTGTFVTFAGSMVHYHHFAADPSVTSLLQLLLLKIFVTEQVPKVTRTSD